jgi:hypothetical protein
MKNKNSIGHRLTFVRKSLLVWLLQSADKSSEWVGEKDGRIIGKK